MTDIRHINCGTLLVPGYPTVVCHCLALIDTDEVVLVDTGIGLLDVRDPDARLGRELIDAAGFQFNTWDTAVSRLESMGVDRSRVGHIVLTHADPDHAGGLADFAGAQVHVSDEERGHVESGHPRYVQRHFEHGPRWRTYAADDNATSWFGLPARRIDLPVDAEVLIVPLPGHTLGHCGVAIAQDDGWFLHAGDAYYLRAELTDSHHPAGQLAAARADDDAKRLESLATLRRIVNDHSDEVEVCGYHDLNELPAHCVDSDKPD
ncbi:MAG: MBL fold hydrolase [Phycisphaerae bacterium]|nr:MBL fold hydrolase [Phycisphaerae bacterium]